VAITNKTKVVCRHKLNKKGRTVTCRRFLMEISDYQIVIPCPNCGHVYVITRRPLQGFDVKVIPKDSTLLRTKEQ